MSNKKMKILIAEDDPFLSKIMKNYLENEGYVIEVVKDGQEAVSHIDDNAYDLILLDLIMPKKTGFEVLRSMQEAKNKTPVLVFSNLSQPTDKKEAMDLGAREYFVKHDLAIDSLVNIVSKYLT